MLEEIGLTPLAENVLKRGDNLFNVEDILYYGVEWQFTPPEDVAKFLADEYIPQYQRLSKAMLDEALAQHARLHPFLRSLRILAGWKPPEAQSFQMLQEDLARKCEELSEWAVVAQVENLDYLETDLRAYIQKPRQVAKLLRMFSE